MVTFVIVLIGRRTDQFVRGRPMVLIPLCALAVAVLAIVFGQATDLSEEAVLFSGQDAMGPVVDQAGTLAISTLVLLVVLKSVAWGLSLGSARGGPTFPAIFLGVVGGLLAGHLPGLSETPAVAVLIGAMVVSMLRLPLSAIVIALIVTQGGAGVAPLVIVGVVVAYVATQLLTARQESRSPAVAPGG